MGGKCPNEFLFGVEEGFHRDGARNGIDWRLRAFLSGKRDRREEYRQSSATDRGSWIVDRGSWIVDRGSWIVDRHSDAYTTVVASL